MIDAEDIEVDEFIDKLYLLGLMHIIYSKPQFLPPHPVGGIESFLTLRVGWGWTISRTQVGVVELSAGGKSVKVGVEP